MPTADADVMHAHDVGMRQAAGNFGFGEETILGGNTELQVLTQHLDRHVFLFQTIARRVHIAHAT